MRMRLHQGQATVLRDGRERILNVRVTGTRARRQRRRHHARRHQRPRHRAAHRRLGRRRPAHRPRDQESADADPALGRAPEAPLRPSHRRGQGCVRPVHRHDHPPGRRHQAHGRRVLVLRPDAEGPAGARRPHRLRPPGGLSDAGRPAGHRFRGAAARDAGHGRLRPAAHLPGAHERSQERVEGNRRTRRNRHARAACW